MEELIRQQNDSTTVLCYFIILFLWMTLFFVLSIKFISEVQFSIEDVKKKNSIIHINIVRINSDYFTKYLQVYILFGRWLLLFFVYLVHKKFSLRCRPKTIKGKTDYSLRLSVVLSTGPSMVDTCSRRQASNFIFFFQ